MSLKDTHVKVLEADRAPEVIDVLCEAFFDYPVMRFILGPLPDYEEKIRTLVGFFVMARVYRNEVMMGIEEDGRLVGASLIAYPGSGDAPAELEAHRERLWAELGSDARARYEAFGAACGPFEVETPHLHLSMIGVRRSVQGRGLGRALLDSLHQLSLSEPSSAGVTLTTELEENVSLYQHFGYQLVGSDEVGKTFTTWGFFRSDP